MIRTMKRILRQKQEHKRNLARAAALPERYQIVFTKIKGHIWRFSGADATDMLEVENAVLTLFESSAVENQDVLAVTGRDIAGFCDGLMRDAGKWTDVYRRRLNRAMTRKYKGDAQQ